MTLTLNDFSPSHEDCNKVQQKLIEKCKSLQSEKVHLSEQVEDLQEAIQRYEKLIRVQKHENEQLVNSIRQMKDETKALSKNALMTMENVYQRLFIASASTQTLQNRCFDAGLSGGEARKLLDELNDHQGSIPNLRRGALNFCLNSTEPSHLRAALMSLSNHSYFKSSTSMHQFVKDHSPHYDGHESSELTSWSTFGQETCCGRTSAKRKLSYLPESIKKNMTQMNVELNLANSLVVKMSKLYIPRDQCEAVISCLYSCNSAFLLAAMQFYDRHGSGKPQLETFSKDGS
eukprot:GHVH01002461.1.p3 GENE.GHVH01002461.1~~GHVH01002461.1.p3  ORF type:complete len:289 (+),score=47.25 GHVH01002461.1:3921-4787(+)